MNFKIGDLVRVRPGSVSFSGLMPEKMVVLHIGRVGITCRDSAISPFTFFCEEDLWRLMPNDVELINNKCTCNFYDKEVFGCTCGDERILE